MRHTLAIAAFALAALSAPAAAQSDAADALAAIDDPERIEALADAIEHITGALLDMPVGPLLDTMRRIDPDSAPKVSRNTTLGDITRTDPDLAERMGDEARVTGTVAGQTARDIAVALPVLRAMASDLAAQWRLRIEDARRNQR